MTRHEDKPENRPLMRLYALIGLISKANNEDKLTEAERRIDDILKGELEKHAKGEAEAAETAALGLATHRLEHLIAQRRVTLEGKQTRLCKREPDKTMAAVNEPAFGPELTSRDVREFESEQFCSVTVIDGAYIT